MNSSEAGDIVRYQKSMEGALQLHAHRLASGYAPLFWAERFNSVEPFDFDAEFGAALLGPLNKDLTVRFVPYPTLIRMKEQPSAAASASPARANTTWRRNSSAAFGNIANAFVRKQVLTCWSSSMVMVAFG